MRKGIKPNMCIYCTCENKKMNSYGSVSLVSGAIYKLLRQLNWFAESYVFRTMHGCRPRSETIVG